MESKASVDAWAMTEAVRERLSEAGVLWRPCMVCPESNTMISIGGVEAVVSESHDGALRVSAYCFAPEQVVSMARGGDV